MTGYDRYVTRYKCISTHTPLAGRDGFDRILSGSVHSFLLTRPSRDVTCTLFISIILSAISTHTPLAGRDLLDTVMDKKLHISTHTPLAGRDPMIFALEYQVFHF